MNIRSFVILHSTALACLCAAQAAHIWETLSLKTGFNAVYLESTPDESDPDAFFASLPVAWAGAYVSDAYADTAQYADDGTESNQKPVSYRVWIRGERSTLTDLAGGTAYLVYATNDCTASFYGIPQAPNFTWRKASKSDPDAIINLIGVSLADGAKPRGSAYFKEGPFGSKGTLYEIGGTGEVPTIKQAFNSASSRVEPGRAYGLTSERAASWPGVLGVTSSSLRGGVYFEANESKASVTLANRGTTNRTVRVTYVASAKTSETILPILREVSVGGSLVTAWSNVAENASWEVSLAAAEEREFVFGIARTKLDSGAAYGGVLVFEDLSGTSMRVRVPVRVAFPTETSEAAAYPTGLWIGKFVLSRITYNGETTPVAAEGTLKPTVLFFVDENLKMTMLQRATVAQGSNGTMRVFGSFDDAKAVSDTARRLSSMLLDPANRAVAASRGAFGPEEIEFKYTVEPKSAGNPFYHVWHPEHNGDADLWAVTNTVTLQFGGIDVDSAIVDEICGGRVLWKVEGLRANTPIQADGTVAIRRLVPARKVE